MSFVRLENIFKRFRSKEVLKGVTLEARENSITVVLGPPGAGKTTMLRIVAGLEKPDRGRVMFGDRDVTELPPQKRNVGLVFQTFALYPHMTVYDNIASPLKAQGLPESEIRKRVTSVAEMLGIGDILSKRPAEISGGQRQRVAIARALVKQPPILLFDEPLTNLDYKIREAMRGELRKILREYGGTVIWATADPQEALALGDYVAVIYDGRVVGYGRTNDIYLQPPNTLVAKYFSYPPMNFINGMIARDGDRVLVDIGFTKLDVSHVDELRKLSSGDRVVVGIRPSDIAIGRGGLRGRVLLTEVLGSETLIHVDTGTTRIVIHVPKITRIAPETPIEFDIDVAKLYFFNKDGNLIYAPR